MKLLVQGDVFLTKEKELPSNLKKITRKQRGFVLAEGEATGHAHVITDDILLFEDDNGKMWLKNDIVSNLIHEEHNPITIDPGIWKIGQVKEYDPFLEESRTVMD